MYSNARILLLSGFLAAWMAAPPAYAAQTDWLTELDLAHLHFEG